MAAAKKFYVFSTLACDQQYTQWVKGGADMAIAERTVLIKGGTGVANDRFVTPLGVVTEIDADQLAICEKDPGFVDHKKRGFITVQERAADPEKVAADMNSDDPGAPLTPADYVNVDPETDAVPKA